MALTRVVIVGLGYVGLPLAVLAKEQGFDVTGIDLDKSKIAKINKGKSPITDEFVEERLKPGGLKVSDKFLAVKNADVVIICVPTPVKNDYMPDLGPLNGACMAVAKNLRKGTLVVVESTINPGVSEEVVIPLMEEASSLKAGKDFYLSHCPERINPGDPKWTIQNIPRVVGSLNKKGLALSLDFYQKLIDAEITPMHSLKEAEACKVVENAFRDVNIAFVNELAMSFSRLGINVVNVINGASTKPFSFMAHYPGVGVGGHCIPVDPYYLIEYAKQKGFSHDFLLLARSINNKMPEFTVEKLVEKLNQAGLALSRAKIAVLGVSYKPNVGDDRESPAYKVIKLLKERGAKFDIYDPYFPAKSTKKSLPAVLANKDAVLLVTNHREFLEFDYTKLSSLKVVIDGRNSIPKHLRAGKLYSGIGS